MFPIPIPSSYTIIIALVLGNLGSSKLASELPSAMYLY